MGKSRSWGIYGILILNLIPGETSRAADPGLPDSSINFESINPIEAIAFQQAAKADFMKCFDIGGTAQDLANVLTNPGVNSALSTTGVCEGSDSLPDNMESTCDKIAPGGKFNAGLVKAREELINKTLGTVDCKLKEMRKVNTQMDCIGTQVAILNNQINALQAVYLQNIQKMQTEVTTLKAIEKDRENQEKFVQSKLGDDNGGLLKLAREADELLNGASQEITKIREGFKGPQGIEERRRALEQNIKEAKMGDTMNCFKNEVVSSYRCEVRGKPVSAKDLVLCRYKDSFYKHENGTFERPGSNKNLDAQAEQGRQALETFLEGIFAEAPDKAKLNPNFDPQNPQAAATANNAFNTMGRNILTVEQIKAHFAKNGSQFKNKFFDPNRDIISRLQACERRAIASINNEVNRTGSRFDGFRSKIIQDTRVLTDGVKLLTSKYAQQITKSFAGLTDKHFALDTSGCVNGVPDTQLDCLKKLDENLRGVLQGNVAQSNVKMQITGGNPKNAFNVSCDGLMGCITKLRAVSTDLKTEQARVAAHTKDFVTKSNQAVDQFTESMRKQFAPQADAVNQRIRDLKARLSALGIPAFTTKAKDPEELKKNADFEGLYDPPKSVLALIGSKLDVPDTGSEAFTQGQTQIATKMNELNQNRSKVIALKESLATQKVACIDNEISKKKSELSRAIREMRGCGKFMEFCDGNKEKVGVLADSLSGLGMGTDGGSGTEFASELRGVVGGCTATEQKAKALEKTKNDECGENLGRKKRDLADRESDYNQAKANHLKNAKDDQLKAYYTTATESKTSAEKELTEAKAACEKAEKAYEAVASPSGALLGSGNCAGSVAERVDKPISDLKELDRAAASVKGK